MLSVKRKKETEKRFLERIKIPEIGGENILSSVKNCDLDLQEALMFLYASMPLSDMLNYPFELFLNFAKHGVFLRKNSPYCKSLAEDDFLNYVLYHRINEEELSDCRTFFYEKLKKRVDEMTLEQAAQEVNYWCAEEVSYKSTDERTASALSVYRASYGRCGEESTFAVSALRSVGIPARQVYVPRWSHCDDNHAWVEVLCNGKWKFVGACEPEPVLNKGWFVNAAARSMMVYARWFDWKMPTEEIAGHEGSVTLINALSHYAPTKHIEIFAKDEFNNFISNVTVDLEILNYSEFFPIISERTDEQGKISLEVGLGSLHIFAYKEGKSAEMMIDTRENNIFTIQLKKENFKDSSEDFTWDAPCDSPVTVLNISQEDYLNHEIRLKETTKKLEKKRAEKCCDNKYISQLMSINQGLDCNEIEKFIKKHSHLKQIDGDVKLFLSTLLKKDYQDSLSCVLEEHFTESLEYKTKYSSEIFWHNVACPRVEFEPLTLYRKFIKTFFSCSQKEIFAKNPVDIWNWIKNNIRTFPQEEYKALITFPITCLKTKIGSERSKKILFVCICRTLGIAARLNSETGKPEYYSKEKFVALDTGNLKKVSVTVISSSNDTQWSYFQNWTLAIKENGNFHTLNLKKKEWKNGKLKLELPHGEYRLITANRLPSGNIFANRQTFFLTGKETAEWKIACRQAKPKDLLKHIPMENFYLKDLNGEKTAFFDLPYFNSNFLFIWAEPKKEPTEHIFNELCETSQRFSQMKIPIFIAVSDFEKSQNHLLQLVMEKIPNVQIYVDEELKHAELTARRIYADPEKKPLVILCSNNHEALYSASGYNVGTAEMLLKILNLLLGGK